MEWTARTYIPPHQYVEAMRLRCNAPLPKDITHCSCGERVETIHHFLECKNNTGYTRLHRHNETMTAMTGPGRDFGFSIVSEPTCYQTEDARRPDLIYCLGSKSVAVDLTIVDPACKTYAPDAALNPGITAARAAQEKRDYHSKNVNQFGHVFEAFAMEAYGHVDKDAYQTLRRLASTLPEEQRGPFVRETICAAVSACLAGTARIIETAINRARRKQHFWEERRVGTR
jgi:hypothetical protein